MFQWVVLYILGCFITITIISKEITFPDSFPLECWKRSPSEIIKALGTLYLKVLETITVSL